MQRELENPIQQYLAEKIRPSVIRSVMNQTSAADQLVNLNSNSNTNNSFWNTDSELITKYIQKKFTWKRLASDLPVFALLNPNSMRPSVTLSMELNETFNKEGCSQEMDIIVSSVDLDDLLCKDVTT